MNYYSDNKEWQWLFKNALHWEKILPLYYPTYPTEDGHKGPAEIKQFLEELLSTTGDWCANVIEPRAQQLDLEGAGRIENGKTIPGPILTQLYKEASEMGAFGLTLPKKYGGMDVPISSGLLMLGQLGRACMASSVQVAFFSCVAEMIHRFGDKADQDNYIPRIIRGEISGSMNLTEPGCGSDLGSLKTSATPRPDGTYLLNGTKTFITNAGGGVGLVLARIKGAPEGLDGVSMFLVDQTTHKNGLNFRVTKNEEKIGLHGSFTCEVVYEDTIGKLIGGANKGFMTMLHLMNEARIAVAMQALGGIENCLQYARAYAEERQAFGRPIAELPLLKRNLQDYETERDAIRALMVDTISHFDIYQRLDLKKRHTGDLTNAEKEMHDDALLWTRKRTPLVKYYACEALVNLSQRAIQVFGGYGLMKEYKIERIHRDAFGPLLYEGTSQIQALMALKDVVKYAIKDPKTFFSNIFYKHPTLEFLSGSNDWTYEFKSTHYKFKKKMLGLLFTTLKPGTGEMFNPKSWMKMDEEKIGGLMVHAETLCQALSYMETLRVLAEHANIDKERADLFFRYHRLVTPRLEGIYSDWEIRTQNA
ncbi:MAG: acyl-CoA/acyl-ACP dehydrogenase [Bdellovibrio sp.]|nr:acyl-CoA/acyl-ACP dehydrogenase [Bdellovibrio sp.]